jgi:threonine synthase
MWRYSQLLPIDFEENRISLGEGWTPMLRLNRLAKEYSTPGLFMKDESLNPTGSFKARGLSMAVSKAKELEIKSICIPTAGNAGSALSAYGAKASMDVHIYMPEATPKVFQIDCEVTGAKVTKVKGNISDAGKLMREENLNNSWFDVTTLKEPFRLEGKKTMGYEIAEQFNWNTPDVIIYPTGGGTGLIGIWKAFKEMLQMRWISKLTTRMVAVQIDQCNPIVQAFHLGLNESEPYPSPGKTIANGLRVPHAFGHRLILQTIKESNGTAISASELDMNDAIKELSTKEGLFICPEGAAVWSAFKKLRTNGWITEDENVVLLNTGSVYKYVENLLNF